MSDGRNRRVHERVAVTVPTSLTTSAGAPTRDGTLCNLSLGGAFVSLPVGQHPPVGSGLLMTFRMPSGFHVRAYAKVVWSDAGTDAAGPGVGVQFLGLDGINREFISHHLASAKGDDAPISAEVVERYCVLMLGERLCVHLRAALTPSECEILDSLVAERLKEQTRDRLIIYLEAQLRAPSSKETLQILRRCLARFARYPQIRGVLVGAESTGMVQLRRLTRDVGIADSLVSFEEPDIAHRFCAEMEAT
jgi:hypothetical protein